MCDNGEIIAWRSQLPFREPAANSPLSCCMKNTFQLPHSSPRKHSRASLCLTSPHTVGGGGVMRRGIYSWKKKNHDNDNNKTTEPECSYSKKTPWIHHSRRPYTLSALCGARTPPPTGIPPTKGLLAARTMAARSRRRTSDLSHLKR